MKFLELPDEILLQITSDLDDRHVRSSDDRKERRASPLLALNLVCHRLNLIAESCIYKRVRIHAPRTTLQQSLICRGPIPVIYALEMKPYRYELIQVLAISLEVFGDQSRLMLPSLLTLLERTNNVQKCRVHGRNQRVLDSTLFQALDSKRIIELDVAVMNIEQMTRPVCLRELKYLRLSDVQPDAISPEPESEWWVNYDVPSERRRIASVQEIKIHWSMFGDNDTHPCAILPILSWVAAVRVLEIDYRAHRYGYGLYCSTPELQRILDVHSTTLERVKFTAYYGRSIPNFRHFSKIERLSMPFRNLFHTDAVEVASNLSAPLLNTIIINMDLESPRQVKPQQFHNYYLNWFQRWVEEYRVVMPDSGIAKIYLDNVYCGYKNGNVALSNTRQLLKQSQIAFEWKPHQNEEDLVLDESDPFASRYSEVNQPRSSLGENT